MIPIIDCGHGGLVNSMYTTAPGKMYTFNNEYLSTGYTVYEGLINRGIAKEVIKLCNLHGVNYVDSNSNVGEDIPLKKRVEGINRAYGINKDVYLLSIHSNSSTNFNQGQGNSASGNEIYLSRKASQKSVELAGIFKKYYLELELELDFPFRGVKRANHYITTRTDCPALLVENLFFDNLKEAKFLIGEGKTVIALQIFRAIKEISRL